jgi:hypothetical protein
MNKTSTPDNSPKAYVLRVSIAQTTPLIWRKLSVPGDYTLGDLHRVLQIAFGWDNDHMHDFTIGSARYGMTEIEGMDLYDDADMID